MLYSSNGMERSKDRENAFICFLENKIKQQTDVAYIKITAFWDIALCSLAEADRRSRGA
jgi:hypothetical protein